MLYSFAREYYTCIEKADVENWESQLLFNPKYTISGRNPKKYHSNLKALIIVFIDFMHSVGVFNAKTHKDDKYLIIGRLLGIASLDWKYHIDRRYGNEREFYRSKITNCITGRKSKKSKKKQNNEKIIGAE